MHKVESTSKRLAKINPMSNVVANNNNFNPYNAMPLSSSNSNNLSNSIPNSKSTGKRLASLENKYAHLRTNPNNENVSNIIRILNKI